MFLEGAATGLLADRCKATMAYETIEKLIKLAEVMPLTLFELQRFWMWELQFPMEIWDLFSGLLGEKLYAMIYNCHSVVLSQTFIQYINVSAMEHWLPF